MTEEPRKVAPGGVSGTTKSLPLTPMRTTALINALKTRHAVLRGLLQSMTGISSPSVTAKRAEAATIEDLLHELEPVGTRHGGPAGQSR